MKETTRKRLNCIFSVLIIASLLFAAAYADTVTNAGADANTLENPGARLHDDFDGTNKDIYVENFTSSDENGVAIYARVKLTEYIEVGEEAGRNLSSTNRAATPVATGTEINDSSTWIPYFAGDKEAEVAELNKYCIWTLGGENGDGAKTYMPTFNKNKDSLLADINGSWKGPDGYAPGDSNDTGDAYTDYVDYSLAANGTAEKFEIYDNDDNDIDEFEEQNAQAIVSKIINAEDSEEVKNLMVAYTGYIIVPETTSQVYMKSTHTAASTTTASVMSMEAWQTDGKKKGNFWVYDTDGWCYWANPIEPGTATGLLLDGVSLTAVSDQNVYCAIEAKAEFVTAGNVGSTAETAVGFWTNGAPTDAAQELLEVIGATGASNGGLTTIQTNETSTLSENSVNVTPTETVTTEAAANSQTSAESTPRG